MSHRGASASQHLITFTAGAAIAEGAAVKCDSTANQVVVAGNNELAIGIAMVAATAAGDLVSVALAAPCVDAKANAAISYGDSVQSVASTGLIGTAASGEWAIGIALEAATAQNDFITILLGLHSVI